MRRRLPAIQKADYRGKLLHRKRRPLQGRTFRVFNKLATSIKWDLIVDLGSNYGEMIFYSSIPKESKIYALEPNPEVFSCLCLNLKEFSNVRLIEAAISTSEGTANFDRNRGHSGRSRVTNGVTNLQIDTVNINRLIADFDYERTLIKIDIEGGEFDIIKALKRKDDSVPVWFAESYTFCKIEFKELLQTYRIFDIDSNIERVLEITTESIDQYLLNGKKGNNCVLIPKTNQEILCLVKGLRGKTWFFFELCASWLHNHGFQSLLVGPKRIRRFPKIH